VIRITQVQVFRVVLWWDTDVSEVHAASIFRGEMGGMGENGIDIGTNRNDNTLVNKIQVIRVSHTCVNTTEQFSKWLNHANCREL
jgi:hypothetical protein